MSQSRTEQSFSDRKRDREETRALRATAMLREAMHDAKACVVRAAFKLGMSEALLRKLRDGGAQMGLHDVIGLAEQEPETFDALLARLAALRGKTVIDDVSVSPILDRARGIAALGKEFGEAITAESESIGSSCPDARRRRLKEKRELREVLAASIAADEAEEARYRAAVEFATSTVRGHA